MTTEMTTDHELGWSVWKKSAIPGGGETRVAGPFVDPDDDVAHERASEAWKRLVAAGENRSDLTVDVSGEKRRDG